MTAEPIRVSAVVARDSRGRILTVRKRGTHRFMLPGGKHDPGEPPLQTAIRELGEEVGIQASSRQLRHLGAFTADAANEPGQQVFGEVFVLEQPVSGAMAAAEIAEIRWLDLDQPLPGDLAPLLELVVLPQRRRLDV